MKALSSERQTMHQVSRVMNAIRSHIENIFNSDVHEELLWRITL